MEVSSANAVILARPNPFDASLVGKALSAFQKTALSDAIHKAKTGWGVLAENLDAGAAATLLGLLTAAGLDGKIVRQDQLIAVPAPVMVGKFSFDPQQITLKTKTAQVQTLPWSSLEVIAACVYDEDVTKVIQEKQGPTPAQKMLKVGILLATGLPLPIGGKTKTVQKTQHQSIQRTHLDLYSAQPPFHFRMDGQSIDFSYLKERKAFSVLPNFKLLLKDLIQIAPEALRNRGTQFLAANMPLSDLGYRSLDDLDRESRWLLTLKHLPA